ncbi:prolyl oligopeptidase family serine peptidase [Pontibacter litorisediminis]|uniref:carboxylesterase family protein n=1 Tax=Pontibacter litorisediminis TaxID=1846260 RepID=UPI0023EC6835|nr:prolyl oligopeptidase family serine peptidase [Pontibacter litorisediminis]
MEYKNLDMTKYTQLLLALLPLLLASISTQAQGELDAYQRKVYVQGNDTLPYRILYPNNFDPKEKYPLVLVLHGAGERGNDNESQLVYGASRFLEEQEQYPAIVVFPQCPKDSYWSNVDIVTGESGKRTFNFRAGGEPTKAMDALLGLLKKLRKSGSVEKDRIYLGGLSMGGMGTFELLWRRPKTFAAAFPICGGGASETARKYAKKVESIWVFHGEEDSVVPVEHSRVMAGAIEKAGGDVKLTVYPGVNHNSWDYAFQEPELLQWLFSQEK